MEAAGREVARTHAIWHALSVTGSMTWEIAWALIGGFALSAVIQAVVRRSTVIRLLGDDRPRTLALAAGLGAASSSCSYAGAIAAWVPDGFWRAFFFAGHPLAAKLWGPLVGPAVAVISFVCSIGNVPLAVVLWKGGISFGGVVAFIFADLIIAPILDIYRKYYGAAMALFLLGTFYAAMATAGYIVEFVFGGLGLIPSQASARIPDQGVSWDYTTWLNIVFIILAAALILRFVRTGGLAMLRMMGGSPDGHGSPDSHDHMDPH
jgi:uncharacterized protein